MKTRRLLLVISFIIACSASFAQDLTQTEQNQKILSVIPGNNKMVLTGAAYFGFSAKIGDKVKTDVTNNFNAYAFNPVFLWKLSDKMFFESEIEIKNGEFALEFAKMSYSLNKYMTVGAGLMLTPFGAYSERWEPSFAEKFPDSPMRAKGPYLPGGTHLNWGGIMGIDVRGALPLGSAKMNYVVFISNGPALDQGSETGGRIEYENVNDNNNNKEIGGRIGLLPLSNSSLEVGFSYKHGIAGDQGNIDYEKIAATAFAIDLSYVKAIDAIKSTINLRGQYNSLAVDKANYDLPDGGTYTFDNTLQNYYYEFSIRPSMVANKHLKKVELLFRYNGLTSPKDAIWSAKDKNGNGGTLTRTDVGLAYWLSWKTGLRLGYEMLTMPDGTQTKEFLARFVYGF